MPGASRSAMSSTETILATMLHSGAALDELVISFRARLELAA